MKSIWIVLLGLGFLQVAVSGIRDQRGKEGEGISSSECRACIEREDRIWCVKKGNFRDGKCCSEKSGLSGCDTSQNNLCSNSNGIEDYVLQDHTYKAGYALCPQKVQDCGSLTYKISLLNETSIMSKSLLTHDVVCSIKIETPILNVDQIELSLKELENINATIVSHTSAYNYKSNGPISEGETKQYKFNSSMFIYVVLVPISGRNSIKLQMSLKSIPEEEKSLLSQAKEFGNSNASIINLCLIIVILVVIVLGGICLLFRCIRNKYLFKYRDFTVDEIPLPDMVAQDQQFDTEVDVSSHRKSIVTIPSPPPTPQKSTPLHPRPCPTLPNNPSSTNPASPLSSALKNFN
ncbi:unnamed protein product [Moneuplotes crassus]|uniref:Uncharacterized protein n=1 Tax=Euplotes crassus TaxID=5936 RepID=A0AAD1UPM2_EUPCR|nr:unnamed protein product [Moneuplotes crassus]